MLARISISGISRQEGLFSKEQIAKIETDIQHMNRKNYGEIIGHTSNDATVTESYYIANNENNYRVGTINPEGGIEERRK